MTLSADKPIVLSGCGWVTPFAAGTISEVLTAARDTRSASTNAGGYRAIPDDLREDYPQLSAELKRERPAWITGVAVELARQQAAMGAESVEADRVGMVVGCALAGQLGMIGFADEVRRQSARFVSPIHFPQTVGNYVSGALARSYDIRGPNLTLSSGVASGLDAIVEACSLLAGGGADAVFAGGTDTLSTELATSLADPGVEVAEGACWFVLERGDHAFARGVTPLATVARTACLPGTEAENAPGGKAIVSAAPGRYAGAICIEHWVGQCFAALGVAAAAAAIGAAGGLEIPQVDPSDIDTIAVGPIPAAELARTDAGTEALVFADADGAHRTVLELVIPIEG
ncbi:MAG: beta-ketoacyl synthase N-terminal-like domain-containing protein [Planctomycetota bacterium]